MWSQGLEDCKENGVFFVMCHVSFSSEKQLSLHARLFRWLKCSSLRHKIHDPHHVTKKKDFSNPYLFLEKTRCEKCPCVISCFHVFSSTCLGAPHATWTNGCCSLLPSPPWEVIERWRENPNYLKRSIPWIYNILIGKVTFGYTTVR